MPTNLNIEYLSKFNLSGKDSLKLYSKKTRDDDNLKVFKCIKSDVIVVEKCYTTKDYYAKNLIHTNQFKGNTYTTHGLIQSKPIDDDIRRFESYKELIRGAEILDFGCGKGDFLKLAKNISKRSLGVELNLTNAEYLNDIGIKCVNKLSELNGDKFDLITINHVFEHLYDPINTLIEIVKYLKDDGTIIIEVPHAKDLLLETFELEPYKNFTLWSEHLILHTKESLKKYTANAGLYVKSIKGLQRYPISNHYQWLLNGKPSGHEIFYDLNDQDFHKYYEKFLDKVNRTDTLLGYFGKNI